MKFIITLKDPDGVANSISEKVFDFIERNHGDLLDPDTKAELYGSTTQYYEAALEPWIEYNEYITVEIDTFTGESRVIKPNEKP
jgi:hypothetical protein